MKLINCNSGYLTLPGNSERVWSREQMSAINHPAAVSSVLVAAAAGSGKTAVLVERVIRLLTDRRNPVRADKIVLVTFTRKAAAEMKERLEKALRLRAESESADGLFLIQKQLMWLEEARITTINAFCLNLLRENSGFIGLEPGFRVADTGELELLAKKAMAATLETFYESDKNEVEPVCAFFGAGSDLMLRRAVWDLHEFTRNIPDGDEWIDEQMRLYDNPDEYFNKIVPLYYKGIKKDIAKAIELINVSMENACCDSTIKSLRQELDFFKSFEAYEFESNPSQNYNCIAEYPSRRSTDKKEDIIVKELIKEQRERTKKIKDDVVLAFELIGAFKDSVRRLCPVIKTLVKLYGIYSEAFTEIKRAHRVIDFPDSEQLCLRLFRSGKGVMERIQSEYELIIVDEFQDSNFLQYELFRLLDSGRGRLFLVGDIKQSVYRFRGADSAVFNEVLRNPDYKVIHLSRNFRSSNQVIDSVNGIFDGVMRGYDEESRLRAAKGIDNSAYETEVCLLSDEDFPGLDGITAEAEYTAARIKKMLADGFKVTGGRKCDFGDFAVLSSAGEKNFKVYEKVFGEQGVPCVSAGGYGYLKTAETGIALDLLMVINNPYNDLSLLNVMMSPLYGFTAEEVAVIRAGRKTVPLYSAVLQGGGAGSRGNEKVKDFLGAIARYRRIADISAVSELIAVINGEGGFLPLIADSRQKANIRLLSYYAGVFAKTNVDSSLPSFLAYIKDLKESGIDVRQANVNSKSRNCVRLMTIHGAKGLEFPVCFVARVNQEFNFRGDRNTALVKYDKVAGIAADCFDSKSMCRFKTLHGDYAARINRELTVEEEMRKFYVAATRAECKLIFTGFVKGGKGEDEIKVRENSYLQLIMQNGELRVGTGKRGIETAETDERPVGSKEVDIDEIIANISAEYPRKILSAVPRKLTATQVGVEQAGSEYDEPSIFPRNPSFHGLRRLTGKKRGDAYHKAMELIDFSQGDYSAQLKSLENRFTPIEYKAINHCDILVFFESPLGRRAVKSEKLIKEYKLYTEIELSELGIADLPCFSSDLLSSPLPFIQGIADMFFYEGGEIVLVDYKTNRNTTAEKLSRDYKGQLAIYKKAIEEMSGDFVKECYLYSFELGEILL
ncbi:MAG: UvrD-helicase domain-containing protein [Oscillospiraceae bacterium]|nr:UvrD-helicase domain-containing protein [Oscillospiraceae bacterium]